MAGDRNAIATQDTKPVTQLAPSRFHQAEYMRHISYIIPEAGTPFDAVMHPSYLAHNIPKLRVGGRVEVAPEDGRYWADLLVVDCGVGYCKLKKLNFVNIEEEVAGEDLEEFDIRWAGAHSQWRVVRRADKRVMKDMFKSKADARIWAAEHAKTLAA